MEMCLGYQIHIFAGEKSLTPLNHRGKVMGLKNDASPSPPPNCRGKNPSPPLNSREKNPQPPLPEYGTPNKFPLKGHQYFRKSLKIVMIKGYKKRMLIKT